MSVWTILVNKIMRPFVLKAQANFKRLELHKVVNNYKYLYYISSNNFFFNVSALSTYREMYKVFYLTYKILFISEEIYKKTFIGSSNRIRNIVF